MSDHFIKYLEDNFSGNSFISISEIKKLKRNWDAVEQFSDCDEEKLVVAAEKAEDEYRQRKRQRMNNQTDESNINQSDEELVAAAEKAEDEYIQRKIQRMDHQTHGLNINHSDGKMLGKTKRVYSCEQCGKQYSRMSNLNRHIKTHITNFTCNCRKTFNRIDCLNKHMKVCKTVRSTGNEERKFKCKHCDIPFDTYEQLFDHVSINHPLLQTGGKERLSISSDVTPIRKDVELITQDAESVRPRENTKNEEDKGGKQRKVHNSEKKRFSFKRKDRIKHKTSALGDSVQIVEIIPQGSEKYDILQFFSNAKESVRKELKERRDKMRNIKWYLSTNVQFKKDIEDGKEEKVSSHFRSTNYISLQEEEEEHDLNEAFQKMNQSLEEFVHKGSNRIVEDVLHMDVVIMEYLPLSGSSYIELPIKLRFRRGIVNVQNDDNKCFLWSVLAALHPVDRNPQDISQYRSYENQLNMKDIEFPVSLSKMTKFEKQNNISINVFGFEEGEIFPLYLSKLSNGHKEVDLLYLADDTNQHFCWIKNLDRFLRSTNKHNRHFYCRRCLYGFTKQNLLDAHRPYCNQFDF